VGEWKGVRVRQDGAAEERYFRLAAAENTLLEAVVVDADKVDAETVREILSSIDVVKGKRGACRRWRAFGLDAEVPSGFLMETCTVLPASVEWQFKEGGEQPCELTFSRTGMLRHWLKGNPADWWEERWRGRGSRVVRSATTGTGPERVYLEERHTHPEGAFRRIRPLRKAYTAMWISPGDGRLYRHTFQCVGRDRYVDFGAIGSLACIDNTTTGILMGEHFNA
jgi:hypothetical protein